MSESEKKLKVTKTICLQGGNEREKRQEILEYFYATYDLYEKLFEPLSDEAFFMRADRLRHPLVFYFGHTATFYVNKMTLAKLLPGRLNPEFESLFAIGVDEMSWDDLLGDDYVWPPLEDVRRYRAEVREKVGHAIQTCSFSVPITWEDPIWSVLMGIEHERIHLETSAVLIRQLPLRVLSGNANGFWNIFPAESPSRTLPTNELITVMDEPKEVTLGRPVGHDVYGWDTDYGTQKSTVPPFQASKFLVSNGEFLEFVQSGGYCDETNWSEEGKRYLNFKKKEDHCQPLFWVSDGHGSFRLRLMLEVIDMPWDWPVEVNYLEAKAFCNWLGTKTGKKLRLPTEDEYHVLRSQISTDQHTWDKAPGNINMEYYCSSTPVDLFPPTSGGFHDVIGNVWQHTETPVDAFPGFRVHPYYDDFSVPTYDLQHNLIVGGSWVSTGNEATLHARYAFRRHFYQFAGLRYIETDRPIEIRTSAYENDEIVNEYNEFHYGPEYLDVENFAKAVANVALRASKDRPQRRALDLGCAVGRSVFELAREFDYVLGLDFSARFIRSALNLKENGSLSYKIRAEGDLMEQKTVSLEGYGLEEYKERCEFFQADACNLDPRYDDFDLVLAANLVDRLYNPSLFLGMVHERIKIGGLLVVSCPYSWSEEHTPKERWIGGFVDGETGKEIKSFDGLKDRLSTHFRLVGKPVDVPFVLRETSRKFQYNVVEIAVWERFA